jgi:hypothetical protein
MDMRYALTAAALIAAASFGLTACGSPDASEKGAAPKTPESAIPRETARSARKELLATYSGTATLQAEAADQVVVVGQGGLKDDNKVRLVTFQARATRGHA